MLEGGEHVGWTDGAGGEGEDGGLGCPRKRRKKM